MLVAATTVLAGPAQAHRRFGWAASQGIAFDVTVIAAALAFGPVFAVTAPTVAFVAGRDGRTRRRRVSAPGRG